MSGTSRPQRMNTRREIIRGWSKRLNRSFYSVSKSILMRSCFRPALKSQRYYAVNSLGDDEEANGALSSTHSNEEGGCNISIDLGKSRNDVKATASQPKLDGDSHDTTDSHDSSTNVTTATASQPKWEDDYCSGSTKTTDSHDSPTTITTEHGGMNIEPPLKRNELVLIPNFSSLDNINETELNHNDASDDDDRSVASMEPFQIFSDRNSRTSVGTERLSVTSMINSSMISCDISSRTLKSILVQQQKISEWMSSFYHTDPRWQILKFFDDVAREGAVNLSALAQLAPSSVNPLNMFARSSVFTVWRPTSLDSIRKMMLGEATGKGLDIKGKSATKGKLSGFVPFLQIHEEAHKKKIGTLRSDGRMRIFYKTEQAREMVVQELEPMCQDMMRAVNTAKLVLTKCPDEVSDAIWESSLEKVLWDMKDPSIKRVDLYAPRCYGVDIPERLFWESYVMRQDCSRPPGSDYDTGRPSQPAFQDMNFAAVRNHPYPDAPRAVVWQYGDNDNHMCPTTLIMAYEEKGQVSPVVSDFDAFLVGTRGVRYTEPLPPEQIELIHWCVSQIETILESEQNSTGWTSQWLNVLKTSKEKGFTYKTPRFGYGDPKSYYIFNHAIRRLEETNGAVRHGAECFNYGFPQDIDDKFLVINDTLSGKVPWRYVDVTELQDLLCQKIDEGFTFPLNPKWILCDNGWKRVYDKLLKSPSQNTQASLNCWLPPESGLRERIECISARYQGGFHCDTCPAVQDDNTSNMDLVEHEFNRHLALMRAKKKLRNVMFWSRFCHASQRRLRERECCKSKRLIA
mmetsp:Transcript_53327/g.79676  ORF Transcript_53327/g.79676 Transcript_53327/m.79676 type:complete len:799 (+) Transcript_53327:86-2482(+)